MAIVGILRTGGSEADCRGLPPRPLARPRPRPRPRDDATETTETTVLSLSVSELRVGRGAGDFAFGGRPRFRFGDGGWRTTCTTSSSLLSKFEAIRDFLSSKFLLE
jgi:hypothetical protein